MTLIKNPNTPTTTPAAETYNNLTLNSPTITDGTLSGTTAFSRTVTGIPTMATGRSITLIVAASNAETNSIAQADYTCDGTADDVQIQAAIDSLTTGTVQLTEGTFNCTTGIVGKSNITIILSAATILSYASAAANTVVFSADGTIGSAVALTSNATQDDDHIHLVSTTFNVDDLIMVSSAEDWEATYHNKCGELQWVKSKVAGTVTLQGCLEDSYTTANTAAAQIITPVTNFRIIGNGGHVTGASGKNLIGVHLFYVTNCDVAGVYFDTIEEFCCDIEHAWNTHVHDCYFKDANEAGMGYGVVFGYASEFCSAYRCAGVNGRHMMDTGVGSGTGIPRHIYFYDNYSYGYKAAGGAAYDTHIGEDVNFLRCHDKGSVIGIKWDATSGTISHCSINSTSNHGIETGDVFGTGISRLLIDHCEVIGCGSYGFDIETLNTELLNCTARNCLNYGVILVKKSKIVGGFFNNNTSAEIDLYNHADLNGTIIKGVTCLSGTASSYGINIDGANIVGAIVEDNDFSGYADDAHSLRDAGTSSVKRFNTGYYDIADARIDDAINSGDATTDGVIDALRDAVVAFKLVST